MGNLTLQILSLGKIKALVLMLQSPHFSQNILLFLLKTCKYCSRRNVTRIIGKSSTEDEITTAIWCTTDVCSTKFFFFLLSSPIQVLARPKHCVELMRSDNFTAPGWMTAG